MIEYVRNQSPAFGPFFSSNIEGIRVGALMQKYGLVAIGTIPEKTTNIDPIGLQVVIGPRMLQVSCRINSCACKRG